MKTHLAILYKRYLDLILDGKKTIEARFSKVKSPPYGIVSKGDKILLKETGGPIKGEATAKEVKYYTDLTPEKIMKIIEEHKEGLMIKEDFLDTKINSKYLTLIFLSNVKKYIPEIPFVKKDRRAWVVLSHGQQTLLSFNERK